MKKLTCILLISAVIASVIIASACEEEKGVKSAPDIKLIEAYTTPEGETTATQPVTEVPVPVKTVPSSELSSSQYKQLVSSYNNVIANYGFSGEVYVTEHNKPIYKKGVNYADKDKKIKTDEYTIFRIASVTKQFTAAGIMILQERGKLSVKDKLSKYFPNYKYGDKITIDHLLRMRSGIPDYMNFYSNVALIFPKSANAFKSSSKSNRQYIKKSFMEDPLLFTPGSNFKYSNSGYLLLGEIIEQVSGTTYEKFIKKEIFDKLGMKYSGFIEDLIGKKGNIARPYNHYKGCLDVFKIKGAAYACGNIYSNAVDLSKWANGLLNNKIISAKSLKAMTSDPKHIGYAYGLFTMAGGNIVYHTGSLCPYNSIIIMSQGSTQYTCIVLSSYNCYTDDKMGKQLREIYAGYFSG